MRFVRGLGIFLLFLFAIGIAVVWTFPANVAYRWFAGDHGAVRLEGIEGRVWNGRAAQVWYEDEYLGALEWTLPLGSVLRREPDLSFFLSGGAVTASGQAIRGADRRIRLPRLQVDMPARMAESALDIPALVLQGVIEIELKDVELSRFGLERARGRLMWRDAAVAGAAEALLGDLFADVEAPSLGLIEGRLYDGGGPLSMDGWFRLRVTTFDAEVRLAARDDQPQVIEALRYAGEPQPDGSVVLRVEGTARGAW
ncbi:MAG TPA: type II secretion system protein N [Xanthomonadaceae bacterium]|nr:type II secretion system protein N [Xanthomonadaceae bacterium]